MSRLMLAASAAALLLTAPTLAEQGDVVDGGYTQLPPVNLYDGPAPGMDGWPGDLSIAEEGVMGGPAGAIYNVSTPTYEAYLPTEDRNTGTAVVIAPGGAFRILAMAHEGHQVAEYLAERGVAAFVLKYRLVQMQSPADLGPSMEAIPMDVAGAPGSADGARAIAMIRERAEEYRIDPSRVVIVGFSAGAHVAAMAAIDPDPAARADYAAPIYGAPFMPLPALPAADSAEALPPMFLAMAQDDPLVGPFVHTFVDALAAAGYQPEVHFYRNGGHGFGMTRQGTASDRWIDDFFWWMQTQGLTQKPGDPPHEVTLMPGPDLSGG